MTISSELQAPVTTFFLVRHAHADWTPDEMRPLSAAGRRDAEKVADLLAPLVPEAAYTSPQLRARQTVEPLATRLNLTIEEVPDLRERDLPSTWQANWEAAIRPTWEDFSLPYPAGGESNAEAQERAKAVFEKLLGRHRGQSIVAGTHGNLLVLWLNLLDSRLGFEFWRRLTLPDVYRLDIAPDGSFELQRLWQDGSARASLASVSPQSREIWRSR